MTQPTPRRILQLIPATDWYAGYGRSDGGLCYRPVACWALVKEVSGAAQEVVGMDAADGGLALCDDHADFVGYYHRTEMPAEHRGEVTS